MDVILGSEGIPDRTGRMTLQPPDRIGANRDYRGNVIIEETETIKSINVRLIPSN